MLSHPGKRLLSLPLLGPSVSEPSPTDPTVDDPPASSTPITPPGDSDSGGSVTGTGGTTQPPANQPVKPTPQPEPKPKPDPAPVPAPAPEPPKDQTPPPATTPAPAAPQPQPQPQPPVQNVTQPAVQNTTVPDKPTYHSNATINTNLTNVTAPVPIPTANSTLLTPLPTLTKPNNATLGNATLHNITQPLNGTMLGNATNPGINAATSPKHSSSLNVDELIGIIAGSFAGLVIICSILSIPLRRQRRRARKVDWLDFSASRDQPDDDEPISSAEAVMRHHRISMLTRHRTRKPSRGGGYGDDKDASLFNNDYRTSYGGGPDNALTPNIAGVGGVHHGPDGHGDMASASAMYQEPGYEMGPVMMHPGGGHMGMGTPYGVGMSQGDGTGPAYYYANLDATNASYSAGQATPQAGAWYPADEAYTTPRSHIQQHQHQQWAVPYLPAGQDGQQYGHARPQQQQHPSGFATPLPGGPVALAAGQDDAIAYAEYFGTMGEPDEEPAPPQTQPQAHAQPRSQTPASPARGQAPQMPTRSGSAATGATSTTAGTGTTAVEQPPSLLATRRSNSGRKPYPKATSASSAGHTHTRDDSIVPITPLGKIGVITVANASPGDLPYPDNRF